LEEEFDNDAGEILWHSFDIPEGDMYKPTGFIEAASQNEAMKVGAERGGAPPTTPSLQKLPRRLKLEFIPHLV